MSGRESEQLAGQGAPPPPNRPAQVLTRHSVLWSQSRGAIILPAGVEAAATFLVVPLGLRDREDSGQAHSRHTEVKRLKIKWAG